MRYAQLRSFVVRHRVTIQDLGILAATLLVAGYLAFEFDLFLSQGHASAEQLKLELDELLLLSTLFVLGMLIFAVRRFRAQQREAARRLVAEQRIRELAFQDPLTGLPNRRRLDDALQAVVAAPPGAGETHALLLLDLNGFKQVNDVYGHGAGDDVLVEVARRLTVALANEHLAARLGGDEFAIVAQHLAGPEAVTTVARRIAAELAEPVDLEGRRHAIDAGIGIALIPGDATTVEEAMRKADVALYRAKTEKRTALRFFEADMDRMVREREQMQRALRAALAAGEIGVSYQPSVDLRSREVVGFEAQPRWHHAEMGEIPPARFIPIAEEAGLVHALATTVLRQACSVASAWPAHVQLSVDLFPGQLADIELAAHIEAILRETGVDPARLELEIPESMLVQHLAAVQQVLGAMRELGVKVALDHFGTGYSSLYHLRNFKLDKIKIDRSFVEDIGARESAEIVNALVGLGRGLGLTLSAEGIGDAGQRAALLGSGCEQGQGYFFSNPVSADETRQLVSPAFAVP